MLYSLRSYEQNVGENVKAEKKVQNDGARGVAETAFPSYAAEPPGGPFGPRATFASSGNVGPGGPCPCGDDHSEDYDGSNYVDDGSVYSPGTAAGSGFVGVPEDPDTTGHEIYCGCPDCRPSSASDDSCPDCGEICDDEFCFCKSDCTICGEDLSLEQFTFTITPDVLPVGDHQDCWNPATYMAFWDDDELIVADTQSDARWRVISCEPQTRAASRQYYTWYCERIGVLDPCDEDFMKSISS